MNTSNLSNLTFVSELSQYNISQKIGILKSYAYQVNMGISASFTHDCVYFIFFMQLAFNLYELSGTRHKNYVYTIIKNMVAMSAISILWWLVGFAFYSGESVNGGIGKTHFAEDLINDYDVYDRWNYSWAFVITSFSVAQTVVVERLDIHTTVLWAALHSLIIFPISLHWGINSLGWLHNLEYIDITGCGFVFCTGVASGIAVLLVTGKRINKDNDAKKHDFRISNMIYLGFSGILFWYCRFGYNNGSMLNFVSNNEYDLTSMIGISYMNICISASISGLSTFVFYYFLNRNSGEEYSLLNLVNGVIVGLISVSGAPQFYRTWAAVIIGLLAAAIYILYSWIEKKLKLDDPLNSIAVNLTGGTWGIVAVGWFHKSYGILYGDSGYHFGIQLLGMIIYLAWPFASTIALFLLLKVLKLHRMNPDLEILGVDNDMCDGFGFFFDEASAEEYFNQLTSSVNREKLVTMRTIENAQHAPLKVMETERKTVTNQPQANNHDEDINLDILDQRGI